jgi:peroxiredoxin
MKLSAMAVSLTLILCANFRHFIQATEPVAMSIPAPELKGITEWINSKPMTLKDLRGRVVVLNFYAFGCVNCIRNYPHYKKWHSDFTEKAVTILGVHTPETVAERNVEQLRKKIIDQDLSYPTAVDARAETWNLWGNRWWPSVYLIDKKGVVRYRWDGELNWGNVEGERVMRSKIVALLEEKD